MKGGRAQKKVEFSFYSRSHLKKKYFLAISLDKKLPWSVEKSTLSYDGYGLWYVTLELLTAVRPTVADIKRALSL